MKPPIDDGSTAFDAAGFGGALARPGVVVVRGDAPRTRGVDTGLEALLRLAAGVRKPKRTTAKGEACSVAEALAAIAANVKPSRVP